MFNKIKQTYLIICYQWENSLPYLENTNSYVSVWIAFLCLVIFSNISLFVSHSPPSTKHPHDLSSQEERRELPSYSLNPINFFSILVMVPQIYVNQHIMFELKLPVKLFICDVNL